MKNKSNKIKRKVTLRDVGEEAGGVSVATVSNVLNNTGSVGDAVKKQVLDAIEKLNYRPNKTAQAMKTGRTKTLGLVLPDLTNPFFPELAQSAEEQARKKGYSVILIDTQGNIETEKKGIQQLSQYGVDGILWCPITSNDILTECAPNIPAVVIDRPVPNYDSVSSDYISGEKMIAEYVIQQGHNKIGIACGPQKLDSAKQRMHSFLDCIQNHADIVWVEENEYSMTLNQNLKKRALANDVSLIVAGNDLIAISLMALLMESGLNVPDDISVIGFDDIPWCSIVSPKLTSIRQPTNQMGQEAVNTLLRRIEEPEMPKLSVLLDVSLSIRSSVSKKTSK